MSPAKRRRVVVHVQRKFSGIVSQRRACRVFGQPRSTQKYYNRNTDNQIRLELRIVELSKDYGKYGYRRIMALLMEEGWYGGKKARLKFGKMVY